MLTLTSTQINGFPNPRCVQTGDTAPFKARNAWTQSWASSPGAEPVGDLASFVRWTCSAGDSGNTGLRGMDLYGSHASPVAGAGYPVVPGKTLTFAFFARSSRPQTFQGGVRFFAGTTYVGPAVTVGQLATDFNGWRRVVVTVPVPPGATQAYFRAETATAMTWATGDTVIFTGIMIGESDSYFDGSYSPSASLLPAWLGAANASPSVLSDSTAAVTVTDGTSTVAAVELLTAELSRPLRRDGMDVANQSAYAFTSGTPGLLAGRLVFLCASLAQALTLESLYKSTALLTLTAGELYGWKHRAVGSTSLTAEKSLNGSPARWLLTVDVKEATA